MGQLSPFSITCPANEQPQNEFIENVLLSITIIVTIRTKSSAAKNTGLANLIFYICLKCPAGNIIAVMTTFCDASRRQG